MALGFKASASQVREKVESNSRNCLRGNRLSQQEEARSHAELASCSRACQPVASTVLEQLSAAVAEAGCTLTAPSHHLLLLCNYLPSHPGFACLQALRTATIPPSC